MKMITYLCATLFTFTVISCEPRPSAPEEGNEEITVNDEEEALSEEELEEQQVSLSELDDRIAVIEKLMARAPEDVRERAQPKLKMLKETRARLDKEFEAAVLDHALAEGRKLEAQIRKEGNLPVTKEEMESLDDDEDDEDDDEEE